MTNPGDHRRGRHVVPALQVHLAFGTNDRRGVLDADMLRSCQDATRKVCREFGAELREVNGQDYHVHPLVQYLPKRAVSALAEQPPGRAGPAVASGVH
jgi:putative transposase